MCAFFPQMLFIVPPLIYAKKALEDGNRRLSLVNFNSCVLSKGRTREKLTPLPAK